ncbi:hypothetical protein [Citrobacter freundii]|uniref:Uncharacterized protein n=1 Tax=Citrobacter freundii TaxID=546 RepID=A0A7G2IIN3_CITFR|nr:hypothetical protein [Citrobacter freundii]
MSVALAANRFPKCVVVGMNYLIFIVVALAAKDMLFIADCHNIIDIQSLC